MLMFCTNTNWIAATKLNKRRRPTRQKLNTNWETENRRPKMRHSILAILVLMILRPIHCYIDLFLNSNETSSILGIIITISVD